MKTRIPKYCIILLLLLCVAGDSIGQWIKIAPNLLPPSNYNGFAGGAIHFKDGVLWAGAEDQIFSSPDSGKTWIKSIITGSPVHAIVDINFYDKFTGLMSQGYLWVYITHDGGLTWQRLYLNTGMLNQVSFNHSPNIIHVLSQQPDAKLYTSLDEGQTWYNSPRLGDQSVSFAISLDDAIYVHSSFGTDLINEYGSINFSTDLGKTWSPNMNRTDGDCYAIAADSCDADRLYLANEEWVDRGNDSSKIYLTTNRGASWKIVFSHKREYLSGTLATTRNVIYTGCISPYGILRSTDRGITWKDIGGPSVPGDSRTLAVADDQTVFALDAEGSIWRTTNSGGDSLKDFAKVSLVAKDVTADTIGTNDLLIPMQLENLGEQRDVECIVHYDEPSKLKYLGSFSESNVSFDIPGQQWEGRSKLRIPNASSSTNPSGYARFRLTADTSIKPKVWFDSLLVFNTIEPCAIYDLFVSAKNTAVCNITLPSGCGTSTISDFIRTGKVLGIISLRPNPTSAELDVDIHSNGKQEQQLEIFDELGVKVFARKQMLSSGKNSIHLDTKSLSSGLYLLKIGDASQSFVKVK